MRVFAWLAIVALVVIGRLLHNDYVVAAAEPVALAMLWLVSPRALRSAIGAVAICALAALVAGGVDWMIQTLPVLIAALVGWLFARSLQRGRTPLIARAIAAIDNPQRLRDAAVLRYATGLTRMWALFQGALALFGAVCVAHAHGLLPAIVLPSPPAFGALLPVATVVVFLAEFVLRPLLLPQAPRHPLLPFLRDLARAWPDLMEE
jgi:uncharacterized membrane protein